MAHRHIQFEEAVLLAAAAEAASRHSDRFPRRRICSFLCQLAFVLEQGGASDHGGRFALGRKELPALLGLSLVRVKRGLALLQLFGETASDGDGIRVLDWRRVSETGRFDFSLLAAGGDAGENTLLARRPFFGLVSTESEKHLVTASGDTAFFG